MSEERSVSDPLGPPRGADYKTPVGSCGLDCCTPLGNSLMSHYDKLAIILLVCFIHLVRNVKQNAKQFYNTLASARKGEGKYANLASTVGPLAPQITAASTPIEKSARDTLITQERELLARIALKAVDPGDELRLTHQIAEYQVRTLYSMPTVAAFVLIRLVMIYLWIAQLQPKAATWFLNNHTLGWKGQYNCNSIDPHNIVFGKPCHTPNANRIEILQKLIKILYCSINSGAGYFLSTGIPNFLQGFFLDRHPGNVAHAAPPPTQLLLLREKPCDYTEFRRALDFVAVFDDERVSNVTISAVLREKDVVIPLAGNLGATRQIHVTRLENLAVSNVPNQLTDAVQEEKVNTQHVI